MKTEVARWMTRLDKALIEGLKGHKPLQAPQGTIKTTAVFQRCHIMCCKEASSKEFYVCVFKEHKFKPFHSIIK